jgi:hypothetical protein
MKGKLKITEEKTTMTEAGVIHFAEKLREKYTESFDDLTKTKIFAYHRYLSGTYLISKAFSDPICADANGVDGELIGQGIQEILGGATIAFLTEAEMSAANFAAKMHDFVLEPPTKKYDKLLDKEDPMGFGIKLVNMLIEQRPGLNKIEYLKEVWTIASYLKCRYLKYIKIEDILENAYT